MAELKVRVKFSKMFRAKKHALEVIYDSLKDQYSRIYDYGAELMKTNPESTVRIQMNGHELKKMYICFLQCIFASVLARLDS